MGFFLPSVVLEELGVGDCIDMGVSRGSVGRFPKMGVMAGGVSCVGKVEVLGLIEGFVDGLVLRFQSMVRLTSLSQGSPKITVHFHFLRI